MMRMMSPVTPNPYEKQRVVKEAVEETPKSKFGEDFNVELSKEAKQASENNQVELSDEEQAEVEKLKERDTEVRQHEMAHVAAAGSYAKGGPQYDFKSGPDGRQYAVAGQVQIDTGKESTPEKTLSKAQVIIKASMAPQEPSSQDRKVASEAQKMAVEAREEITQEAKEPEEEFEEASGVVQNQQVANYGQAPQVNGQSLNLVA
jgi:hypothetical protein